MNHQTLAYLIFGVVLFLALLFDLGLLSKKNKAISIKAALWQTIFWIALALGFFVFLIFDEGQKTALEYLSAYLMEWSLSIDNIFVFILVFTSFKVKETHYGRVLLTGILMAIILRVIFISIGVELVERFSWLLYLFGIFLVYTGIKMFAEKEEKEFNPHENKVYKFLNRFLPLSSSDGNGRYIIRVNGKPQYTVLFVVVMVLATVDVAFALDSIPAIIGVSQNRLVIYTSNVFAVLGLRSLFFLLRNAVNKFKYLQQGISIVLIFIGLKMLGEHFISQWIDKSQQVILSLIVIIVCIGCSVIFSIWKNKKFTS